MIINQVNIKFTPCPAANHLQTTRLASLETQLEHAQADLARLNKQLIKAAAAPLCKQTPLVVELSTTSGKMCVEVTKCPLVLGK